MSRESELPEEVAWKLERADGFLDLGMLDRAAAELEAIPTRHADHMLARRLRLRLLLDQQAWTEARELAHALRDRDPAAAELWVLLAYATRRSRSVADARVVLEEAVRRFPDQPVIRFNLACYACQSGELEAARRYLHQALILDRNIRDSALEDDDLRPLWSDLEAGRI
jgi:Flp pilus assembly protein TadD